MAIFFVFGVWQSQANPQAGANVFTRPLDGGIAISVQALLLNDSDSGQIPIFVGQVDGTSAQGGTIWRTNDWLYYTPPISQVATDSFHYVLSNLVSQTTTGTVTIVAGSNFLSTNILEIALLPGGGKQIQFFGNPGSYFIQSSSNLVAWTNEAARLAWPTNYFQFADTSPPSGRAKFYRTATGARAPVITNYQASGTANVQVDFTLGIEGGADAPYPATVLSLPARGYLFRDDGSILSNTPAGPFGVNGSLHYFEQISGNGSDAVSFQYKLTRPSDGLDSLPAAFEISLAPDVPTLDTPIPNVPENGSAFIQLIATDPDLRYASNHLSYLIVFTTTRGKIYQVNQDGSVNYSQQINDNTFVSNTNNLVFYVPPLYQRGTPFESFTWQVINSFQGASPFQSLPIDVYFVNSPPVAEPGTFSGWLSDNGIQVYPQYSDPDDNLQTLTISKLPARGQLHLIGNATPTGIVSATNNSFSISGDGGGGFIFLPDSETNGLPCIPDAQDYGSPYASFTYVVTDTGGLSATNTCTIDILPLQEPFPYPATPNFTGLLNSTNIPVFLAASNLAADTTFTITALPAHGTLFVLVETTLFPLDSQDLPLELAESTTNFVYVPDPGYYSSRDGTDSFAYYTLDRYAGMTCSTNVSLTVIAPPMLTNTAVPYVTVTLDSSGNLISPGTSTNLVILPGDANPNSLLQMTFSASPIGSPPYGHFTLNSTNGLASLQTNPPVTIEFEGTAAALNAVLTNGVNYYPGASITANTIVATLNDLGATGFGTNVSSVNFHLFYLCSGCGIGH